MFESSLKVALKSNFGGFLPGVNTHLYTSGVAVVVISTLILVFDIPVPNELKGFIFYAQVLMLCDVT